MLPRDDQRWRVTCHFRSTLPSQGRMCTVTTFLSLALTVLRSVGFEVRQSEFKSWFHILITMPHWATHSLL